MSKEVAFENVVARVDQEIADYISETGKAPYMLFMSYTNMAFFLNEKGLTHHGSNEVRRIDTRTAAYVYKGVRLVVMQHIEQDKFEAMEHIR